MDLKKIINYKFSLDGSGLEDSKLTLSLTVIATLTSVYLIYLIFNTYQNYDVYQTTYQQLHKIEKDEKVLQSNFRSLVKNNNEYFSNLQASPKSRSELASALNGAISQNNLKLIRLNSNDSNLSSKDALVEIEAAGTYANIDRFTRSVNKFIGATELQSLKLTKVKEENALHLALSLKFASPPSLSLPIVNPDNRKISQLENDSYGDWKIIKAAFVQADTKPEVVSDSKEPLVKKDPFQSPEPIKADINLAKSEGKLADQRLAGYYLSGIFYSKHHHYCVVSLPTGESKVFKEGDKISPLLRIRKIIPGYVITNSKKSFKTHVGEELLP